MIKPTLRRPKLGAFRNHERFCIQRMENNALIATDRAATGGKAGLRAEMSGANLGRLGMAIGSGSDLRKSGRVRRFGANGFRASGWIFIRSKSERTLGAIEAYTEGADIAPRSGSWLWIASKDIPARVGRYRMTPARYNASGLVSSIGPLVMIPGRHSGEALLIVKNVSTRPAGRANPRRLPRSGRVRAGREVQEQFVAFVGIRRTSRSARISVGDEMRRQQSQLRNYYEEANRGNRA